VTSPGLRGIRSSFALRTVAGGVVLVVALVLLASVVIVITHRRQQVDQVGETARSRAVIVAELIERVSGPEAVATARDLAGRQQLATLLASQASTQDLQSLLTATTSPSGVDLYVVDSAGTATAVPGSPPWSGSPDVLGAVGSALRGVDAGVPITAMVQGRLAQVVAVPVRSAGATVGAVTAVVPLEGQVRRFAAAVGYPVVLFGVRPGVRPVEVAAGAPASDATALLGGLPHQVGPSITEARSTTTLKGQEVVIQVVAIPQMATSTGYVGVVVPVPGFVATEGSTMVAVALLAILAATLTSIAVWVVVDRWVRRPVAALERGVARIAEGEYATTIAVPADDELGRLAGSVNRMAEQIAEAMEGTRTALSNLRWVSEALTAVDLGPGELSAAVARAAAAIAGEGAGACLIRRQGEASTVFAHGLPGDTGVERAAAERGDLGVITRQAEDGSWRTSFPLAIDEGVVTGRLVVSSAAELGAHETAALGTLASYAGLVLDHARLLEQEHQTVRRLRAADSARTEFLSTTHHELRTPLSVVLGMAELAESSWDKVGDAERRHFLGAIVAGAQRLARTIEGVLTMTVLASEEVPLSRHGVPLRPLVESLVARAAERWKVDGPRRVAIDVPEGVALDADSDFLERMLDALVDNAMKFTSPGGAVEISARRDGEVVVLQVRDDGIGVPEQALPHVFERFYQAERGHVREFGGLGLGLTVAARICAVHGATISLANAQPRGAVATVRWPAADESALSLRGAGSRYVDA
jgi:two-component system, OmpR family, sensor histidine kinase VicK